MNYLSWNPKYSIVRLYDSLFFLMYSNNIEMTLKVEGILSRLALIPQAIDDIQKNITYYSNKDLEKTYEVLDFFVKLFNNLPLFIKKHNSSKFIGDKRPDFHFCIEATFDNIKTKFSS